MIGKIISNYEIKSLVGEGGMGNVYLAEHVQLGRQVAIKMLHPRFASNESLRGRFRNEAAAMAHLQHPNIVSLHDYVESNDGLFLIMEYVEGIELDRHIKEVSGPIEEKMALNLMDQILDAFDYAHQQGVVHRDIKPSNILMTRDNQVKVLDFGIAKLLGGEDKSMTKTGTQMGTVLYMSPEQVKGEKVDARTDIYSLGVTLFQIVTGVSPYAQDTTEYEVYSKIIQDPLPRAASIYPGIPDGVQAIIDKATVKTLEGRFQTCKEMKSALINPEAIKIPVATKKGSTGTYADIPRLKILQNMYFQFKSQKSVNVSPRLSVHKVEAYMKYSFGMTTNEFIKKYGKIQMLFDLSSWGNGKGGILFSTEVICVVEPSSRKRVARKWSDIEDIRIVGKKELPGMLEIVIKTKDPDKSRKAVVKNLNAAKRMDLVNIFKAFREEAHKLGVVSTSDNAKIKVKEKKSVKPQDLKDVNYDGMDRLQLYQNFKFQYEWRCFVTPRIPKSLLANFTSYCMGIDYDQFVQKYGNFQLLIDLSKNTNGRGGIVSTSEIVAFYESDNRVKQAAIRWKSIKQIRAKVDPADKGTVRIQIYRNDDKPNKDFKLSGMDPQIAKDIEDLFARMSSGEPIVKSEAKTEEPKVEIPKAENTEAQENLEKTKIVEQPPQQEEQPPQQEQQPNEDLAKTRIVENPSNNSSSEE